VAPTAAFAFVIHRFGLFSIIWNIPEKGAGKPLWAEFVGSEDMAKNTFGIIGGDERQIYLARSMQEDGYEVSVCCLENARNTMGLRQTGMHSLVERCNVIILPLPATRDGCYLNTPLSNLEVRLDGDFARLFLNSRVFGGMLPRLTATSDLWRGIDSRDYYSREELVTGNAYLTAEGAIGLAVQEYEGGLGGSQCLVTGYGRIGKALCGMLKGMGARVSCSARRASDLTSIRATGCRALSYSELVNSFDIIFNTVPARVLDAQILESQRTDTLIIELASAPGGIDLETAGSLGLRVLAAPSLPGRMSPKASGELIKETVYNMLNEDRKEMV
jgi:dipicolinate synthase subunit A